MMGRNRGWRVHTETGGIRMGYDMEGNGTPLVLLHGFPLNRAMWRAQVAGLRDRFTVIAPDFRGFGDSEIPRDPMSMDAYAQDVLALLDALGCPRFALGGLSMGGYVAFRVMALAAERVSALLIADSRAEPDTEEGRQRRHAAVARIENEGPAGYLEEFAGQLVGPTTRAQRPGVVQAVREIIGTPPARSLTAALSAMASRPDSRSLLGEVKVPALVVVGEEDTLTPPEAAEAMVAALPNARLVRIPAAGHMSNLEAPEAFTRAVREFLAAEFPTAR
jgi:pimeloyl-ACP methyl ester carboxylesterase